MTQQTMEALVTTDQLSDFLGIPKQTIRKWRSEGNGPQGMKIGKHVRYTPEAVRLWLRAQQERG